ncbi:MAG: glycerol-3-phosphate acyltransferase [Dehalococcoidia bacterium]|nr:glycerol-3-phosphate acyltransferase [Dehalococcoidia bacterium]|tara:strand:- start:779 stop:1405 length:627 start_codon:yes stop_codon:yes gene_type:complete
MIGEYFGNVAIGYALGSIPTGLLLGYLWMRKDIREFGSGKTGMTNLLRTAGAIPAGLGLIIDITKGVAPVLIGRFLFEDLGVALAGSGAAVLGHVWPVFAGFRGGRGVATSAGSLIGIIPILAIAIFAAGVIAVALTRRASVMSLAGGFAAVGITGGLAIVGDLEPIIAWYVLAVVVFLYYMHIPNIRRLMAGTEPQLGRGGEKPASG